MSKKVGQTASSAEEPRELAVARPSHITAGQQDQSKSLSLITEYAQPPRLKVMQKTRREPLDTLFRTGDLVAMPSQQLVAAHDDATGLGRPFLMVPVFFYPEFISTNPIELGNLPMIRERTLDPKSKLAAKCRSEQGRQEPHPENGRYFIRNMEVLTFVVMILDEDCPLKGIPLTLPYFRGEFKYGRNFASLIQMRNVDQCFGCVFQGQVGPRKNDKGDWKGVNVANPPAGVDPWVSDPSQFNLYSGLFERFAEAHDQKLLRTDLDVDEVHPGEVVEPVNVGERF